MPRPLPWIAFALLVSACSTWSRIPAPLSTEFPAFKQYRVWARNSTVVLRSLRIERDSLNGVPANQDIQCSTCRLSIALSQVDSISTGKTEGIGAGILGIAAGGVAFIMMLLIAIGTDSGGD